MKSINLGEDSERKTPVTRNIGRITGAFLGTPRATLFTQRCYASFKEGKSVAFYVIFSLAQKDTKANKEHIKPQFQKYIAKNFDRILTEDPDET
jgi:hypothetical protein